VLSIDGDGPEVGKTETDQHSITDQTRHQQNYTRDRRPQVDCAGILFGIVRHCKHSITATGLFYSQLIAIFPKLTKLKARIERTK